MKKITIIIPVYNVENYLDECIQSVLKQTHKNFEIILVDDGSTDKSGCICDAYKEKDDRIQVIHKQNGGVSEARNTDVALAKSEYIALFVAELVNIFGTQCVCRELNGEIRRSD